MTPVEQLIEACRDNYAHVAAYLAEAADLAGIPLDLIVGCGVAESKLNALAERWGTHTVEAQAAILAGDAGALSAIITAAGNDISFGVSQRIVAFHWAGTGELTVPNCLYVRSQAFADPRRDILEMGRRLRSNLTTVERLKPAELMNVGGDTRLGACVIYNAGHWPEGGEPYWKTRQANIQNYRNGLEAAPVLIAGYQAPVIVIPAPTEGGPMTIEDKAKALTDDGDRLGNGGAPYTPKHTWETDQGPMSFQGFWYGYMWEFAVPVSDSTPDGRDTICEPYPTLLPEELAHFRGSPG
jgi:hypothetical protein